jgi:diketogulonate reductase-like aldo/keto reductase
MGVAGFLVTRVVTVVILFIAISIGWLAQHELPAGLFFATIIPLLKGIMPPEVVGHGHMVGTPVVLNDMQAAPRPTNEMFLDLPGGYSMPANGLGMCCRPTAYDHVLVRRTVLWYLLLGGRHIDGAHLYLNHEAIGLGIQDAMARGVPRSEIFVTTKIFPSHFGHEKTLATLPTFLGELGLDYIDLVLMHAPSTPSSVLMPNECTRAGRDAPTCRQDTWKALSELRASGKVRNVGVSNFGVSQMEDIIRLAEPNEISSPGSWAPIANNQIQFSPFAPAAVQETVAYCQAHNITITAYSPLGGLTDFDRADADQALQTIANAHNGVTVQQVMLRWILQQTNMAVIPGTGNPEHMRQNLAIYDFTLTDDEMKVIDGLKYQAEAEKFMYMDVSSMA